MKPYALHTLLVHALDTSQRLIADEMDMSEERRQAVLKLGMSAANLLVEMGAPESMRAVHIWCELVRAWIDEPDVHETLERNFPRIGLRLDEVRVYVPSLTVATIPQASSVQEPEIDLPPQRSSETAVWDIEAERWIEPEE